jgi:hypothetical protein
MPALLFLFIFLLCSTVSAQSPSTVVIWTANVPAGDIHGEWAQTADTTAAGGSRLRTPNRGASRIVPSRISPTSYFDIAFAAEAGVPYRIWLRMRASGNHTSNDSVHVQFSDSVDAAGVPAARIGTTSSLEAILHGGASAPALLDWGWADARSGAAGAPIYFAESATHVIRIQQREDGASVDQIVLSPDTYLTDPPGHRQSDNTILQWTDGTSPPPPSTEDTVVLWTADTNAADIAGAWQLTAMSDAAGGNALRNPNTGAARISPAFAAPANYFELAFPAKAGMPYHVWVRMRADGNSTANDSVHIQFDAATTGDGTPFAPIGTNSSAEFVLQAGSGAAAPQGWGWTENGWGSFGTHLYFASTGTQRLRVQQREDGPTIDQIVISADAFLTTAPGARRNDATILPRTTSAPGNELPAAALTAPAEGATFTDPASIVIEATASDPDGSVQRVDFYSGSTLLGSAAAPPYTYRWDAVAAGDHVLTARAIDDHGGQTTSAAVHVTVEGAPDQAPTVSLTSPANGAAFMAPAAITLTADAADPEDQLTRVDFFSGATLVGSDSTAPYSFSWSPVAGGTYSLSARAVDAAGHQTQSAAASVTVNEPPPPPPSTFTVAFTASTDHDEDVTSYMLHVFSNGADPNTDTPVASSDLGKPAPDPSREIRVDRTSFLSGLAPGTYLVTVSAVGPGGSGRSAPYSFTR